MRREFAGCLQRSSCEPAEPARLSISPEWRLGFDPSGQTRLDTWAADVGASPAVAHRETVVGSGRWKVQVVGFDPKARKLRIDSDWFV